MRRQKSQLFFLCLHCTVLVALFLFMATLMDSNVILLHSQLLARFVNFIVYLQLKSVSNKIFSIFYRIVGISDIMAAAQTRMQHGIAQCKMTFITSIFVVFFRSHKPVCNRSTQVYYHTIRWYCVCCHFFVIIARFSLFFTA